MSYNLKQKYPKLRRNLKFDDDVLDLALDFSTDPDYNAPWKKVTAVQAKQMKGKLGTRGRAAEVSSNKLDRLLDKAATS